RGSAAGTQRSTAGPERGRSGDSAGTARGQRGGAAGPERGRSGDAAGTARRQSGDAAGTARGRSGDAAGTDGLAARAGPEPAGPGGVRGARRAVGA
ncbi:unnamed protein product, partial [Gulo gulo]